jgi:hypothetical protein
MGTRFRVNLLPLLCAKLFAPITALGTALATVSGLPAGPDVLGDPAGSQLAATARPAAGLTGGYQLGGDRDDVSYAAALGPSLAALYRQAAVDDPASLPLVLHGLL